ncbi:MAG TPA: hypothetical protein VMK83_03825 [Gaiellaceae bacterium]|nr:hypothetical protein [Gaiellaceae bacterium]
MAVGLVDTNPAKAIPNPEPKRTEIVPFATLAEVDSVSAAAQPLPRASARGLPDGATASELLALERRDVDKAAKVLHVRRVLVRRRAPHVREDRALATGRPARSAGAGGP